MEVLEASAQAAAAGLADTETVADVATSAMNAWRTSNLEAADAIGNRMNELSDSLKQLNGPAGNRELALSISGRITELTELIEETVTVSTKGGSAKK